jgi:glucose/arabinose dehydrogenase
VRPAGRLPLRRQALLVLAALLVLLTLGGSGAGALPTGFQETTVFTGLTGPAAIEFAADGRVFVAEKTGRIKVFNNLSDSSPDVFADLSANTHDFWDRGMLGFALDPDFTTGSPYAYVLYTYDAPIGGSPPTWGDNCPSPPGATGDGCVVSARLSRLTASGNFMTGSEQVLINDWCQQYPSHSIGSLAFGADGALYVSGGDGASFTFDDWGQEGNPVNPCGDPPGGVGGDMVPPTAEGGALRSQDLRTPSDPTTLDGAILRVNPDTGAGMPNNPLAASSDPNTRRIIAHGLRNPFRLTIRPGTNEVWLGDVGWITWEEIDRIADPLGSVENFGWPCYEANDMEPAYANLNICANLYAQGPSAVVAPYYTYNHSAKVVAGESCPTGSSSTAGLAFYPSGPFPAAYDGALFFADYSRDCIWVMFPGGNGLPDASNRATFQGPAASPVDLQVGPDGALYYADYDGGTIRRIAYAANQPPIAAATGSPTSGAVPLTVNFDGSGSSDPEGGQLTYAWDLDGDGAFDDSTAVTPTHTYTQPGTYNARLRVTDAQNLSATSAPVTITPGNTPPTATINTPALGTTWKVDDVITFSGSAADPEQGTLPASALSWQLIIHHCPSNCHQHLIQTWSGVASGSFNAPDHEYPSHLELRLTATDGGGLTDTKTLLLDPRTVELSFQSSPSGLQLAVGGSSNTTPFTRTVIEGSNNTVAALSPQTLGGTAYAWQSWSDGGAQSHNIIANAAAAYTATYQAMPPGTGGLAAAYSFDEGLGTSAADASGNGNTGTIGSATWIPTGKFSNALSFNGTTALVTVNDSASLDLTTGMTLEAWVYPTAGESAWRDVIYKGPNDTYYLEGSSDSGAPATGGTFAGPLYGTSALPLNVWSHLAATFDSTNLRLYVNGVQVSSTPVFGQIGTSTGR